MEVISESEFVLVTVISYRWQNPLFVVWAEGSYSWVLRLRFQDHKGTRSRGPIARDNTA